MSPVIWACYGSLVIVACLETVWPARKAAERVRRFFFHGALFYLNSALHALILRGLLVAFVFHAEKAGWGISHHVFRPGVLQIIFAVFLLDLCSYLLHRLHHSIPLLWKFHRVHHTDREVDVTSALREHPVQVLTTAAFQVAAICWVGPGLEAYTVYTCAVFGSIHFHHANLRMNNRLKHWLGFFIVTPEYHLIHHIKGQEGFHFSNIFPWWDALFRTRTSLPSRIEIGSGESLQPLSLRAIFYLLALIFLSGCFEKKVSLEAISPQLQTEIDYGRELIVHTARYLGPKGKVAPYIASRMNCQNCHLDAGKKPYGISFVTVHARYPDYRAREGKVVTLADRINHCMERPMNGRPLPLDSREMRAMLAYFKHLASGVAVGTRQKGDFLNDMIQFPTRAADRVRGRHVFEAKCVQCHGVDGQGKLSDDEVEFIYPPLWGEESYNAASNMHRVIKFAAFVKANMPFGATAEKPLLTDEEAFDVAAFVNDISLHPRPISKWHDYQNIAEKPIDFPSGPYADSWSNEHHRWGPFLPIIKDLRSQNRVAYY